MKIALAQILAVDHNREQNLERQVAAIADAKKAGADFILFPEMFDIGYTQPNGKHAEWVAQAIT